MARLFQQILCKGLSHVSCVTLFASYFEWIGVFHAGKCLERFTIAWSQYGSVLLFVRGHFWYWKERLRAFVFNCQRWNSLISWGRTIAKASAKDVSFDQERKLGDRRWLDTVVVLTINFTIQELDWWPYASPVLSEKSQVFEFWGEYSCKAET